MHSPIGELIDTLSMSLPPKFPVSTKLISSSSELSELLKLIVALEATTTLKCVLFI